MNGLFLFLFLVSIVCLIVGLVQPKVFSRFFKDKANRKFVGIAFGIATILFFILFGVTSGTPTPEKSEDNSAKTETKTISPEEQAKKDADDALAKKQADEAKAKQEAEAKAQAEAKAEAEKLLDASVQKIFSAPAGIQVINNEKNTWYGCKFVLNDKYTKQYNDDQGIGSGESEALTIPYAMFLKSDGTRFNYVTTAPTSFLISCKVNGNTRNNVYTF